MAALHVTRAHNEARVAPPMKIGGIAEHSEYLISSGLHLDHPPAGKFAETTRKSWSYLSLR
jgi:hypothetical protein